MTATGTNDSRQQEVRDHDYKKVNDLHYQTYLSAATDIEVPFNPHVSE